MKLPTHLGLTLALATGMVAAACSPYQVRDFDRPGVEIPEDFTHAGTIGESVVDRWWEEFEDPALNAAIETALTENLDLRQAWSRLDQAAARARIVGAERIPQISADASASRTRFVDDDAVDPTTGSEETLRTDDRRYVVGAALGWEIDIWRRIESSTRAEQLRHEASREDVEETALVLSSAIADVWFAIQEQKSLLEVLEAQVDVSATLLELTELRFSLGEGSALDVLQQRQQLAATRSATPPVRSILDTSRNALAVLLGVPPGRVRDELEPRSALPELPPFPSLRPPVSLLSTRPDLRAALRRLSAADNDVAAAVADRFPRLSLSLSYDFSATDSSELFHQQTASILGNLTAPLVDGGRRRAEVDRRKAIVRERYDAFSNAYLAALREVEDALARERNQLDLIARLEEQLALSRSSLEESRSRYASGLTDYTNVIIAVQALQELERRVVSEHRQLLSIRTLLYRATGGTWMRTLTPGKRSVASSASSGSHAETQP